MPNINLNLRPAPMESATKEELYNYIAYLRQQIQFLADTFDGTMSSMEQAIDSLRE